MRSSASDSRRTLEALLRSAVERSRAAPAAMGELRGIYVAADRAVARARLRCLGGGGCCRFDLFGHRLYLTGPELALLTAEPPPKPPGPGRCPYQVGPACGAYPRRPLGCRTFFCGREGPSPTGGLHEQLHGEIRGLHRRHCIPYAYAELCQSLWRWPGCE